MEESSAPRFFEKFGEEFLWQDDDALLAEQVKLVTLVNPPRLYFPLKPRLRRLALYR
ncbi:MAG: hypothetical protein OQJ97_02705 [Rhodospirillales bacterium]|nr:hypothetical protein [Rhodospirillales bacterium]